MAAGERFCWAEASCISVSASTASWGQASGNVVHLQVEAAREVLSTVVVVPVGPAGNVANMNLDVRHLLVPSRQMTVKSVIRWVVLPWATELVLSPRLAYPLSPLLHLQPNEHLQPHVLVSYVHVLPRMPWHVASIALSIARPSLVPVQEPELAVAPHSVVLVVV